ncbi:MAG: NAD(P)/FAD-dependent oxidoreductase [Lachnospirales bacterium]
MRYVVLGASAAAISGVRSIRKNDKNAEIILISKDDKIYSRCILHRYLSGIRTIPQLNFAEADFEKRYNVNWIKGNGVKKLINEENKLILDDDTKVYYDRLLIATGSSPSFPPIENIEKCKNVYGFRNISDVDSINEKLPEAKNIVVLGAGLVGMDVTTGLIEKGIEKLTLIDFEDRVLSKQIDEKASNVYANILKSHNVNLIFKKACKSVQHDENGNVVSITITDDIIVPCDLLIVTIGVKSNVGFLKGSSVEVDKFGVVTDELCHTNIENIYAAGDVTGKGPIWPIAVKEGIVAGTNITGGNARMEDFFYSKSTMNFFGVNTMVIGLSKKPDDTYVEEIFIDDENDIYKKVIHKDGIIAGATLQGDLSYGGILTRLVSAKIDFRKVKKSVFKIDYSDFFHIDENAQYYYGEQG